MVPLTSGRREEGLVKLERLKLGQEEHIGQAWCGCSASLANQGRGQDKPQPGGVPSLASTFLFPRLGREVIGNDPRVPFLLLLWLWFLLFRRKKTQTSALSKASTSLHAHPLPTSPGGGCCWAFCFCWNFSSFSRFFASFLS